MRQSYRIMYSGARLYSMIHLTCNITNLYYSARWHARELCNNLFERVFYCIYAIPHPDTYPWCQFRHFYIQNEVSHATNVAKKFSFKKVRGDLDREERFQVANRDLTGFHQRILLATRKAIWSPLINRIIKRFEASGGLTRRESRGRPAYGCHSCKPQAHWRLFYSRFEQHMRSESQS